MKDQDIIKGVGITSRSSNPPFRSSKLILAVGVIMLGGISLVSYTQIYYRNKFIGNYYTEKENKLNFSFNPDYSGVYVDAISNTKFHFRWLISKADVDSKVFKFTEANHNLPVVNIGRTSTRVSWVVTITTAKNIKEIDNRYRRFNDDNLLAMDMGTDSDGNTVFTRFTTKKSLWLDIKNLLDHE